MVIRIRAEPDFFQNSLCSIGFDFLLLLFLLIFELRIIDHLTYRRNGSWRNFYEIKVIFFGEFDGFFCRKYGIATFHEIPDYPHLSGSNLRVYFIWLFLSRFKRLSSSQNFMVGLMI